MSPNNESFHDSLRKQFGKRLRDLRRSRNITQYELAKLAGVSTSFISSVERGIDAPSFETLQVIALALKIQVVDLFKFDSE